MAVKLEIEGFKSLNEQLGQAEDKVRNLVNQFGVGSREVQQAAQEAGKLKQQMMEADRAIESFTAPGRFDAVAGGIQGVVGGFAAVQGAMAVVGVESEALQQTLVKVQGALALVEGVKGVTEFAKSFSTLKTVAVNAFNGIKAAIGSTGIGLLIIGLGIAIQQLIGYFGELNEAEVQDKKNLEALGDQYTKFTDQVNKANAELKRRTDLAVAQAELEGKSIQEIAKIREDASYEESSNISAQMEMLKSNSAERIRLAGEVARAEGKSEKEVADIRKKTGEDIAKQYQELNEKLYELDNQRKLADIALKKALKEQAQKANDDAKKTAEERKKNELDAAKDLRESLRKLAEEKENDDLKNAQLRLKNDLERLKEARDEELKQENLTAKAKADINAKYWIDARTRIVAGQEEIAKITKDKQKEELERAKEQADKLIAEQERQYAKSTNIVDTFFKYKQTDLENSLLTEKEYSRQSNQIELERLERQLKSAEEHGQDVVDLELQIAQKKRAIRQQEIAEEEAKQQAIENFVFGSLNQIAALQQQYLETEINNRKAALQTAYNEDLKAKGLTEEKKADLDYKLALEMEKLNKDQFENEKAMNIVRATISGTQAALNAFQAGSVFGPQTGALFAAVAALFAGAQIAMIASQNYVPSTIQKPGALSGGGSGSQYEMGGLLIGPSHDMGGVRTSLGELEGGEFVMNRRSTANFLPLLEQMNAMGNEGGPQMSQAQATPVIKTYVVASDMTSQQEANARIGRLARF